MQAFEVEHLAILQFHQAPHGTAEYAADVLFADAVHFRGIAADQGIVCGLKSAAFGAFVPDEHEVAAGFPDAAELDARGGGVEPVECLAGGDKVHGGVRQGGGFGAALHRVEARIAGQQARAGGAHLGIRFDTENLAAQFEEPFGQQSGAAADIGDARMRARGRTPFVTTP